MDGDSNLGGGELQWADWLAIGIMLAISAGIGIYYRFSGGRQKTAEEYFAADRSTSSSMIAIAMMVACFSAISLLGTTGEVYSNGAIFILMFGGIFTATPIIAYLYLPVFYELKTLSVFEYLERRFGPTARLTASISYFIQYILFNGVVIYAPSLALEATTGLNGTMSILLIGFICTFYSTIGGIKAVIITDLLQAALMFTCVYCVIGVAASELDGGLWGVWASAQDGERLNFNHFEWDPTVRHTWMSLCIGGMFWFLIMLATSQVQVQRMLTAKSLGAARKAMFLNVILSVSLGSVVGFSGLVLYAYYKDCDPVTAGKIKSYDMIMPYFAKDRMTRIPGLTGLFISGIFSASLSTVAAMLNSLAAMALADYLNPLFRRCGAELDDNKAATYGKIMALLIGIISLGIAFLASTMGSLLQVAVAINGAIGGPLLGFFTLGMFFESANETGAVVGLVLALVGSMITAFSMKPLTPVLPMSIDKCVNATLITTAQTPTDDPSTYFIMNRLSYLWYPPLGWNMAVTFGSIASFIVSKCSKVSPPILDPSLFTPILAARIRRRREKEAAEGSQVFVLDTKSFDREAL
ncbi:putative sodium-dependent multivitamin transporter [Diachasma alloeum]|uniref:putative sodium-dependent multivitamin transporter n=1 Tax=Diachasma alloeum TaxID=454923 RepID=UPI00073822CF|nr:putative sodium-dependent multivitamin transporter [Diachasma alloeum]